MELFIVEPIAKPAFVPNSFSVHITVMHGSEDLFALADFVMPGFDASSQLSVELMKDLLRTLDKMIAAFAHTGRGVEKDERYAFSVPEFEPWFSSEDLTEDYSHARYKPNSAAGAEYLMSLAREVSKHREQRGHFTWPDDITMGGEFGLHNETTLDRYEVRYIDAAGVEHAVEVQA